MFAHEFMRNALLAGTFVGLACGLVGYFVVLRAQVFAGDALSHVAFTGALGAAALGLDLLGGVFVATICGGLAIGALGERARADDVTIGSLFAWTLGLGALFLAIFTTQRSGSGNGAAGVRVLFGSIFGLSAHDVRVSVAIAVVVAAALLAIARPLLFSSLDEGVAEAQGVPVRALGLLFLVLLGVVAAEATQAIGALLLLGLLAAPAGAAQRLTTRPWLGLVVSAALAVGSVWLGLTLAYVFPSIPPSSAVIGVAVAVYAVTLPSRRIVQGSIESITRCVSLHGSRASVVRIASSDGASIAWATRSSSASGPPRTMKPSSTSASMNAACSSQPDCPSSGWERSHCGPERRTTTRNIVMRVFYQRTVRGRPNCGKTLVSWNVVIAAMPSSVSVSTMIPLARAIGHWRSRR
jgi:zinc/manganese transport system permease protein